jgi:hypothetical protein
MGVNYIFDNYYCISDLDKISLENFFNKSINNISNKEFRKWYKKLKLK